MPEAPELDRRHWILVTGRMPVPRLHEDFTDDLHPDDGLHAAKRMKRKYEQVRAEIRAAGGTHKYIERLRKDLRSGQ